MAEENQQIRDIRAQVNHLQAEMVTTVATKTEVRGLETSINDLRTELRQFINSLAGNRAGSSKGQQENGGNSFNGEGFTEQDGSTSNDGFKPKTVRLEFPRFDGEDPETWCCRAEQFFDHYSTPDTQRMLISSFHMEGRAMVWFQELKASGSIGTWEEFARAIQIRFGRGAYDDPMETLSKLKQEGSLEDYKTKFDTLALKVQRLPEEHKLSCFLGGLKPEIRLPVRMFNPKSLLDAYSLARIQEEYVMNTARSSRIGWRSTQFSQLHKGFTTDIPVGVDKGNGFPTNRSTQLVPYRQNPQPPTGVGPPRLGNANPNQALVPVQKITQAQMDERRRKGLCYTCDSKYTRGHVCQVPRLFLIEVVDKNVDTGGHTEPPPEEDPGEFFLEEFPEISLNAITGSPSPKTMRIVGFIKLHRVVILIDSGSTHNFVDTKLAATLGIRPTGQDNILVRIANGQEVVSPGRSREVEVRMQGHVFRTDLFLLPLAGCDVVLGIQWLRTLGPILWDFTELKMEFQFNLVSCTLKGLKQGPHMSWEEGDSFKLPKHEQKGLLLQLIGQPNSSPPGHKHPSLMMQQPSLPASVAVILDAYKDVFQEPKGLPPHRAQDHSIPLQEGAQPVSVRPYRYPFYQKEEIEKIVQELLDSGVI
jgi:hypothetical protein